MLMKQLSLILNIILLLAVGLLYYFHFSCRREWKNFGTSATTTNGSCPALKMPVVAYVDQDSLSDQVTFIKTKKDELEEKSLTYYRHT